MKRAFTLLLGFAATLGAGAAVAHHSFSQFAMDQSMRIEGTVKDFQWTNPHSWIELMVLNKDGVAETWSIEGGGPGGLTKFGWTRKTLQPGDHVTLVIAPLRSGAPGGALNYAILADGRQLDQGQSLLPKGLFGAGETGAPHPAGGATPSGRVPP